MNKSFKIRNREGQEIDLLTDEYLLNNLAGYGLDTEASFQRLKDNYALLSLNLKQTQITGNILVGNPNSYTKYRDIITFLSMRPLTLLYKPENIEYYMDVILTKIDKEELGNNWIQAKCTFLGLERFYRNIEYINSKEENINEKPGKRYSYQYEYKYGESLETNASANIEIRSTIESPCKIDIFGPVVDPKWLHYVNDNIQATGKIYGTLKENEILTISTMENSLRMEITDTDTGIIKDAYELSDFNTERFIWLERGTNYIRVTSNDIEEINFKIKVKEYYESV